MRLKLLAAAVVGLICALPAGAQANHVQCGDTLTQDTTLDSNIVCTEPGATGLLIGADNITVRLAGFTIEGPGAADPPASVGVADDGTPRTGVTVRGLSTITGFDTGIDMDASNSDLMGMTIAGGTDGVLMRGADNFVYRITTELDGFRSVEVIGDNAYLWGNIVRGIPDYGLIVDGDNPLIVLNRIESCAFDGILTSGYTAGKIAINSVTGCDIGISSAGNGMKVQKNDASANCIGMFVEDTAALVRNNIANENCSEGIVIGQPGALVRNNIANGNVEYGIDAVLGTIDGGLNVATGNGIDDCLGVVC